mmetsp:Transcript_12160/g.18375  ORF Transcript_12160/g.18375 Transcript_12160/m.18375 type:complete len:180 (-) Transcript_12160:295-834(-)
MSSTRKSLSGATMGMRFMQRKTPTKASSAVENGSNNSKEDEPMNGGVDAATRTPLSPQHQQSQSNQEGEVTNGNANAVELDPSIPTIAIKADMYGMSAEIIGRRSFNGFNKSVENTYTKSLQSREEHRLGEKVERQQITDEELLERYEKYVKGDGDMTDTKSKNVGSFKKKKRKRSQGK